MAIRKTLWGLPAALVVFLIRKPIFRIVLPALVVCAFAWGQNIQGTITGEVLDGSGARVPGATVTALNQDTGVRYPAITTEAGVYVLPQLPLGKYAVTAEAAGFKTFVEKDLELFADARLRLDVRLEIGNTTETLTVAGTAPLVESERATLGGNFAFQQFDNLPIGRDPAAVLTLVPGTQASQSGGGFTTGIYNGGREEMTDYKVDGVSATNVNNRLAGQTPIEEMIGEVVLQSGNFSAEYGRGSSQISVNTKAGTNEFHGVLFEYFQNEDLNANSFFNNLSGNPRPLSRQNQFGATGGGPVIVPKLYNGRNHTFFMLGYQGTRSYTPGRFVSTVPSAAMRGGNFAGQPTIYDPATTTPQGTTYTRAPFPGNVIPSSRFDPVALNLLANAWPLPNEPGAANNYEQAGSSPLHNTFLQARVDENFNEKNRLTARYVRAYSATTNFDSWPGPSGDPSGTQQNVTSGSTTVSLEHTYAFGPDKVNILRYGHFADRSATTGPDSNQNWAAKVGLKNAGPEAFPTVAITGLNTFGGAMQIQMRPADDDTVADTLLWVRGRHSLKIGFEFRQQRNWVYLPTGAGGSFTFNTLATNNPAGQSGGVGLASFLLGLPTSSSITAYPSDGFSVKWPYYAAFVQDDFKLTSHLTLNLGMRWEVNMPFTESQNHLSSLNLATSQLNYAGQNGYPTTLFDPFYKGFSPRFGLAYSPFNDNKTVIRGGYGIFFEPNSIGTLPFTAGPWSQSQSFPSPDNGITFPITLSGGFPPINLNTPLVLSSASNVYYIQRQYTPAYAQQWNLNVQRQIGNQTLVQIGYVGSKSNHLGSTDNINQVPAALLGPGTAQSRRPYPNVGNITEASASAGLGNSQYHAMQAQFTRRLEHGLSAQAAYTFSKSIDDSTTDSSNFQFSNPAVQNNYNLSAEKSVSVWNQPNLLSWSFVWQLPAGKGRSFLNRGGWMNELLGGWNLSSLSTLASGAPLTMSTVQNLTGSLGGGSRPNRLGNPALSGSQRSIREWFVPAAFALPPSYVFGNDSRTEPELNAPGTFNLASLLMKQFRITEKRYFEFRCQANNALNHFNPGVPNSSIGSPGVGTITGGSAGRSLLLSLRLFY